MTRVEARPRRRLRSEIAALIPFFALFAAILFVFPFGVSAPAPHIERNGKGTPSCAFISLTQEEQTIAIDKTRSAFTAKSEFIRASRTDLTLETLPEEPPEPFAAISGRGRLPSNSSVVCAVEPMPPTMAAPKADKLLPSPEKPSAPAFPKEDLLQID